MTAARTPVPGRAAASGERGAVTLWFAIIAVALLALVVMLVDSGAKIRAADRADAVAAEAARAAVIAAGPRVGAGGDTAAAATAARSYIARAGAAGTVTVISPGQVFVTIHATDRAPLSGHSFTMTRSATARLLVGVERGEKP